MISLRRHVIAFTCIAMLIARYAAAQPATATGFEAKAREVTAYIQQTYYNPQTHLYAHATTDRRPEDMWGDGVMFSALVGAARYDRAAYEPVLREFFAALDVYWDAGATLPGYEPSPKVGVKDKYYDDNEWMVITFEEAYALTGDRRYALRSEQTLQFVLSGWDEQLHGGIWWHEGHKDGSKNTCSNAPAAVACLRVAARSSPARSAELVQIAKRTVDWTVEHLQAPSGLFADRVFVATGAVVPGKLTYNTALMIRAMLGVYRCTHEERYLSEAKRIARAANWFVCGETHAYINSLKWSHLMVEADLALYRATGEDWLLQRARRNGEFFYASWKDQPDAQLINNAGVARALWLLADSESAAGRAFWERADRAAQPELRLQNVTNDQ
jgi:hypothetical protein